MDRKALTEKASRKVIVLFIAAILVASMFSGLVGNVAADVDRLSLTSSNATGPAGGGGVAPGAAGDIVASWYNGLFAGWGVGYDSDDNTVWISDTGVTNDNIEFYPDGTPTSRSYSTAAWAAWWPFDMEYDRTRGYMYQVDSGGDNCIHAWDIDTGNEMAVICDPNGVWNAASQQCGVAYRETDDTLWVGGWIDNTIYHIKGLSSDNPGEVLDSHYDDTMGIAGLAWHCDGYLYVTGSNTQTVYVLTDDGFYTLVESYLLPGTGVYGVGADIDCDGNLWAATLGEMPGNSMTYLLDTDRPADCCPGEAPSPPGVPTVNHWGIAAMITLFAGLLAWTVRRRRLAS